MNGFLQGLDFIRSYNQALVNITSFNLVPLITTNNVIYMTTIFNVTNSTLSLASLTFGFKKLNFSLKKKMNFRLNAQRLIISTTNSTVSLINSVFTNTHFNNTMIDLSYFHQIIIKKIWFISTFTFCGIKIHHGNGSRVIMNSIQFRNMVLEDYFFVFNALDSTFVINDLEFYSFPFKKSKK